MLALTACGSAAHLQPAPGKSLPVAARGAKAARTPDQLLTAGVQTRPQRSDDLLTTSEKRRSNEFDLPPGPVAQTNAADAAPAARAPDVEANPTAGATAGNSK